MVSLALMLIAAAAAFLLTRQTNEESLDSPLPANNSAKPDPQPARTTLFFVGDIMLSRNVGTKIFSANDPTLPYRNVLSWIQGADISFANLESPFNNKGARVTQGLVFKAEPNTIQGLKEAGFDILSTANNHTMDQGKEGLDFTMSWLKENGISYVGTGMDCHDGLIKEVNGIKFGFLAYSYTAYNDGGRVPDPIVCNWTDSAQVTKDIIALKPKVDFLILSTHMGAEYKRSPEPANALGARNAIDAGADLFVGHHPHWVQTIEEYKGKYIFYSLGNFVFDQMWSQDTKEGLGVEVLFEDKNLSRITLRPVIIEDYCCPRPADETETKNILQKINPFAQDILLVNKGQPAEDWITALSSKGQVPKPLELDNSANVE